MNIKLKRNNRGEKNGMYKHGLSHTKLIVAWKNMKNRCNKPTNDMYSHYGAKGIGYSKSWENALNFVNDMKGEFDEHIKKHGLHQTTLDRIDNSKGYSKENCRWSTRFEQARNKTNNRFIEINGIKKNINE